MIENNKICEELWNEHEESLRRICRVKLRSCPDEVDDVISDVFLALCRHVDKNGAPERPKPWIYGTFNNILNMKYREKYKKESCESALEGIELPLTCCDDAIEEKIEEIYSGEIRENLKKHLTADEYEIIKYIYFDSMKMKEIANKIGSTESAVKQKHYRICRKLRKKAGAALWTN